MKKLILVTLLAVAASWVLSESRQQQQESRSPMLASSIIDSDDGQILQAPPVLVPPMPPNPFESSIRTIPWKPGDAPFAKPAASAEAAPSWFPKSEIEEQTKAKTDAIGSRVVVGRVSASEDRACQDLRQRVEREVADWLAADVPTSWKVPARVLDSMIQASYVQEVMRSLTPAGPEQGKVEIPGFDGLYTLYRAGEKLDFSANRRAGIVGMYRQDLATQRLRRLGGGLALALVGLAVLSGYIKADEATKGYYTNRLRLLAAAGLGAAGVAAYRFLV